jgi:hypothetical protein
MGANESLIIHPVIYAPGGEIIGSASTERGAIRCASGIQKLPRERWTASLRERLEGGQAWFVGPQLITTRGNS